LCCVAFGQAERLPTDVKAAKTVFIDNEAGDSSVLDSVRLALASIAKVAAAVLA